MSAKAAVNAGALKALPEAGGAVRGEDRNRTAASMASLREARSQMELLCQMLLCPSPEVLDGCNVRLTAVTREMEAGRPSWPKLAGDRQAVEEARRARQALKRARRLLDRAAQFYAQWQRVRAAMSGYRADGAPGQIPCRARIQVEG